MNHGRRRNVFTLANFENAMSVQQRIRNQFSRRRQNSDPFERDPFKIQSYNFRYAERPVYPATNNSKRTTFTPPAVPAASIDSTNKRFDTFYYNHDFPNCTKASTVSIANNKENKTSKTNKSLEGRRQKFLREQHACSSSLNANNRLPGHSDKTSALVNLIEQSDWCTMFNNPDRHNGLNTEAAENIYYTASQHDSLQASPKKVLSNQATKSTSAELEKESNMKKSSFDSPINRSIQSKKVCNGGNSTTDLLRQGRQSRDYSPTYSLNRLDQTIDNDAYNINRRQNDFSGCEINININSMDNDPVNENVVIKIESDPIQRNLDRNQQPSKYLKTISNLCNSGGRLNVSHTESTHTFNIDKRLSKFSIEARDSSQDRQRNGRRNSSAERGCNRERSNERNQVKRSITSLSMRSNGEGNTPLKPFNLRNSIPSTERLPSLVSWTDSNSLASTSKNKESKNKFQNVNRGNTAVTSSSFANNRRKNLLQKTQENLKGSKSPKSSTNRSLSNSCAKKTEHGTQRTYSAQGSSTKQRDFYHPEVKLHESDASRLSLNSMHDFTIEGTMFPLLRNTSATHSLGRRNSFERLSTVMSRTNSKMPVNVNINVYTNPAGKIRI